MAGSPSGQSISRLWLEPVVTLATSAEAWIYAGGSHHTVLSTALDPEALADFAQIAQVEHLRISDSTTIDGFQKEVRWNGAFFNLSSLT